MERHFNRRLDRLAHITGHDVVPCTCQAAGAKALLFAKLLPGISPPTTVTDCPATVHYWAPDYVAPGAPEPSKDYLVGLFGDPGPLGPPVLGSDGPVYGAREAAVHLPIGAGGDYAVDPAIFEAAREIAMAPVGNDEIETEAPLDKLVLKPPSVNPLEVEIRRLIKKYRPTTVDPGDGDYDDEKWLDLPTDK